MKQLIGATLIDGVIEPDDETHALEQEIRALRQELVTVRQEAQQAKREAARALVTLRQQLSPLYRALQAVFGELDAAGAGDLADAPSAPVNPRMSAVWESWKSRLGVGPAKCIDALLLHGDLNTAQLAIATGYHRNTVPQYVSALNTAGLINKRDGRFSLKAL